MKTPTQILLERKIELTIKESESLKRRKDGAEEVFKETVVEIDEDMNKNRTTLNDLRQSYALLGFVLENGEKQNGLD